MSLHETSLQESNTEPETLTVVVNGIEFHESYQPHKMWGLILRNGDRYCISEKHEDRRFVKYFHYHRLFFFRTNTSFEVGALTSSVREDLKRKAENNESSSKIGCIILKRPIFSSPGAIEGADDSAVEDGKEEDGDEGDDKDEDEDEDEDEDDDYKDEEEQDDGDDDDDDDGSDDENDDDDHDDDDKEDGADDNANASRDADPDANLDEDGDDYDYGDTGPLNTADDDEDDIKYYTGRPDADNYNLPVFEKDLYLGIDPIAHCRYASYQNDQESKVRVRFEFPATVSEERKRARKDNNTVFRSIRNEMFRALSYLLSKSRLKTGPIIRPVLLEDGCVRTCCVKKSSQTPSLFSERITSLCNRCFEPFNDSNFYSWHSRKVHSFCPGSWQNFRPEYAIAEPSTSCQFCGFDKGMVEYFCIEDRKFAAHWYCAHFNDIIKVDPSSNAKKLCCSLCSSCEGIVSKCPAIGCSVRSHPICALASGWCCVAVVGTKNNHNSNGGSAVSLEANKTKMFLCGYHADQPHRI
jgi:hypothetical protein